MKDSDCVEFLRWVLPRMRMRWPGFRKVRRQVGKRIDRRMRELGLENVRAYRAYLEDHREEWAVLDRFCRISISRFYRDRGVFDYLGEEVLPRLAAATEARGERELRCWSMGCASGEEPYTLNMLWKIRVGLQYPGMDLRVIATDSDPGMLERARRGCYGASSLKDVPRDWVDAAFVVVDDLFCVKPEFRMDIEFQCQDNRQELPVGLFHLVLCRHLVFTYFDDELRREMLERILGKLVCGGILVTGKQEQVPETPDICLCRPHTGVYEKRRECGARAGAVL